MLIYSIMIVYLITNLVNDKKYVGITRRELKVRWYEHVKKSKQKNLSDASLHKDISIFGKNNFKIDVLENCSSENEMFLYERKYISEYDAMNSGYNCNSGGASGYLLSDDSRKSQSQNSNSSKEVYVYDSSGSYLSTFHSVNEASRVLTIDVRKLFRVLSGKRKKANNYIFSYVKLCNNFKLVDDRFVEIYKYDAFGNFLGKYNSLNECSLSNGMDRGSLSRVIKNKKHYIRGYFYFNESFNNFDFSSVKFLSQYTRDGVLINKFLSVSDAIKETNISKTSIYRMINNKNKDYYFLWD